VLSILPDPVSDRLEGLRKIALDLDARNGRRVAQPYGLDTRSYLCRRIPEGRSDQRASERLSAPQLRPLRQCSAGAGLAAARSTGPRPRHHHSPREHGGLLSGPQSRLGLCEFKPTEDVGLSLRVITAPACDRFARFAFEYAAIANIDRLAVIHKRTALPQTEGLFIGAFEKLRPEYPNIELELVRIDTFSSSFPRDPHRYRLVATTNLFGDILSDQASGLTGGVGVAPSLNAGGEHAMAQAVHGTAPDIAGRGIANPSALILPTALLLNWFYQRTRIEACRETARLLDLGVRNAISGGATTRISVATSRPTHLRPR
jgi:hypothetical protein